MPEKNFKAMTKMSTRLFSAVLAFVFLQATAFAQTGSIASARATGTQSGCGAPTQTGPQAPGPGTNPAGKVIPSPGLPSGLSGDRIRELEQKAGICEEGKSDNAEKQPTNAAALKEAPLRTYEPNAFQKFVADGTGLLLPMFGYTLFSQVPSTFAPEFDTNCAKDGAPECVDTGRVGHPRETDACRRWARPSSRSRWPGCSWT